MLILSILYQSTSHVASNITLKLVSSLTRRSIRSAVRATIPNIRLAMTFAGFGDSPLPVGFPVGCCAKFEITKGHL